MQAVLLWKDMAQVADKMDPAVFQYVGERQTESFEALEHFDLLAFDWYDVHKGGKSEKVLVRSLNRRLSPKGLCLLPLRFTPGSVLLYLYRPATLRR